MNTNVPVLKQPYEVGDGVAFFRWDMPRHTNFTTKIYASTEENGTYTLYKTLPIGTFFSEITGETNLWVYVTSYDVETAEESAASNKVLMKIAKVKTATNQDVSLLQATLHKKVSGSLVNAAVVGTWYDVLSMQNLSFNRQVYALTVAVTGSQAAEMRILSRKEDGIAYEEALVPDEFWNVANSDVSPKFVEFVIPPQFLLGSDVLFQMRTTDTIGTFHVTAAYIVDYKN